jgi:GNAT superfamily N-acetyltransferase
MVVDYVVEMITQEGYELGFIPNTDNTRAGVLISYRKLDTLRTGLIIYIDGIFMFPECRNQKFAGTLLEYATRVASDQGIKSVHLDSGYTLHTAHR